MIPIKLNKNIQYLESKPTSFNSFIEEINNLFKINNAENYTYEYLTNNNKNFPIDMYNYRFFYIKNDIKEVIVHSSSDEENNYNNKEINFGKKEDENNLDFYDNNNINDNKQSINNQNEINPDIIKLSIINNQKKIIQKSRIEEKEKERILKENNQKNEDNMQINNIKIEKINENISNQLNNIINDNFEKLKDELINGSKIQLSKIVSDSKIKIRENDIEKDYIETPSSVETHKGIVCSSCGNQIVGVRYRCVYCDSFDYCEKCEEEKAYIHGHPFYKLRFVIN